MKRLVMALMAFVFLMSVVFVLPACAETVIRDGIEVTLMTDKESYDSMEAINARLAITNANRYAVQNVSSEITVPDGYVLSGKAEEDHGTLQAGQRQTQVAAVYQADYVPNLPKTGDNSHGMLWGLLLVLSSVVLFAVVIHNPHAKRFFSLFLCLVMLSTMVLEAVPVVAEPAHETEIIVVSKAVLVNGKEVLLTGTVTYEADVQTVQGAAGPTITGEKINDTAEYVKVREGDTLSFAGKIKASEGAVISSVQVFVYDADTEVPYSMGEKYYTADGVNAAEFDLSAIPEMTIGEAFGQSDYALTEGKRYAVMFYATDSNGNGFADMDAQVAGNQGPMISVRVLLPVDKCDHSAKEYTYERDEDAAPRITDNGDSLTHLVEHSYKRHCADCGAYLMNIWGAGTSQDHNIANGMCTGCGYAPIMLMQEIPSISFNPLEKSEYEIFEKVIITWEEREETDKYVVYVKILDGEPASGSDNEDGELLHSNSSVLFANYSFTVPDRAAGKWIKINVHGKNAEGEQTEAASSIYIFVKESGNQELGSVILKATKSGSKVLFTVEGNANEVRLYRSEQIHDGSQLRDGVAAMYYEDYSYGAPHAFSHETSGYHSNKSYLFCVKTDDGRVSNKVFVAGTEICENVPTISEVTLNRSEARLGEPIKIESGTVYGNDLRIYGVEAYMYNENSKIQPAVWDSGYVWDEDVDLSPFDLSSFEPFANKSFMEGWSEPGRHNIYVHIMCYGNVGFTFPTSAEIYLYDEETECYHTEYTDFDNGQIKYTDNKDGETHTWQNGYKRICNICQADMGTVYGESAEAAHDYSDGDVCPCGYDRNNCQHTPSGIKTYNRHLFAPLNEKQHKTIAIVWDMVCSTCGKTYEEIDTVGDENNPIGLPYVHVWKEGKCEVVGCEYECVHDFVLVVNEQGMNVAVAGSGKWQKYDAIYHVCTEIKYQTECTGCGMRGESEYYPAGWKEEHTYGEIRPESYEIGKGGHYAIGTHECTLKDCGHTEQAEGALEPHVFEAVVKKEYKPWGNRHSVFITTEYYCVCGKKDDGYSFDERVENHVDANNDGICDLCKGYAYLNNEFEAFNPSDKHSGNSQDGNNSDYFGVNLLINAKYSPIVKVNKELSAEDWDILFRENAFNDAPGYFADIFANYVMDNAQEFVNDSTGNLVDLARPDDITEGVVIDACKESLRKNIAVILGQENIAEKLFEELKNLLPEAEQEIAEKAGGDLADKFIGDGASWIELDDIEHIAVMLASLSEEYEENLELLRKYREAVENSREEAMDEYSRKAVLKALTQLELEYSTIYKNAREWSVALLEKSVSIPLGILTKDIFTFMGFVVSNQEYERYMSIYAAAAIEACIMDGGMREFEIAVMNEEHIKPGEYRKYIENAEYVYVSRIRQCIAYGGMEKEIEDLEKGLEYILREKNLSDEEIKAYVKRVMK